MTRMPIGRRDFLGARFRAVLAGETPAQDATVAPAPTATAATELAPFDRRARARTTLSGARRVARVDRFACLASTSMVCTSCLEHCPEPEAIRLEAGHPIVLADRCTGCGECEQVCPAPTGAIRVLPVLPARPS